jgi:Pyruvate/2-oxoacid:ferredoxin oxidoreductase gamma subunit
MYEGRHVTWIPSYGPEMRGGTANCSVMVSDEEIASPVVSRADYVVIMNQPSLAKFEPTVKPGGILLYNEDLVSYRNPGRTSPSSPCRQRSCHGVGSEKVANVVVLGALVEAGDIVGPTRVRHHQGQARQEKGPDDGDEHHRLREGPGDRAKGRILLTEEGEATQGAS